MEDVDDESIAKPSESLRHAPTIVARRQPFVVAAAAPKGPKENVFHAPHQPTTTSPSVASANQHAGTFNQKTTNAVTPQDPHTPGAFAVYGPSDVVGGHDDDNFTYTQQTVSVVNNALIMPAEPVEAHLVDRSEDYVENLEEQLQQEREALWRRDEALQQREKELEEMQRQQENIVVSRVLEQLRRRDEVLQKREEEVQQQHKELERIQRQQEHIVVGQVLGLNRDLDKDDDEEKAQNINSNNEDPSSSSNNESMSGHKRKLMITVVAVLVIVTVFVGIVVSILLKPAVTQDLSVDDWKKLCNENSISLAKQLPCISQNETELYLDDNSLRGTIPSQIGLFTKLTTLSLWDNSLTGTVPSEVGLLTKITYLDLSVNSLTGTIPSQIVLMSKLYNLQLYDNNFTGEFTCPGFIDDCWISCDFLTDTYTQACRSL
jgi:TolA-binding protein